MTATGSGLGRRTNRAAPWIALWIAVGVVAVAVAVALLIVVNSPGFTDRATSRLVAGSLGIGVGLVVVAVIVLAQRSGHDRLRALVATTRPDATVIPAYAESAGGLAGWVPTTIVVAVLTDHAEVWADGRGPLSAIALTGAEVHVQNVRASTSTYAGIRITNGADSLSFVPAYSMAAGLRADLTRALRELGEDPDDHLRR